MNKKKAIEILKKQRAKIDDIHQRDDSWVLHTSSYIRDFFGEDSQEFHAITNFHFHVTKPPYATDQDVTRWLNEMPDFARKFIDNCIETIEHKGLYQPPKKNFLQNVDNRTLIALLSLILSIIIAIGGFGYWLGKRDIRLDNKSGIIMTTPPDNEAKNNTQSGNQSQ